ncbi:MAG: RnfABCDGE type electron transport complex subunit D [Oscillospiraceae bacterium]
MNGLKVSPSPHRSAGLSTAKVMAMVVIALLPAAVMGCIYFGPRAAAVLAVTTASAVIFEALFNIIAKKEQTISDLSAVVTGLLLGMNLPASVPFYIPVIGSFIAIVIVKQLFGGIGQNFANPAITARIVLMVSFSQMTSWVVPYWYRDGSSAADAVTGATPLAAGWLDNGTGMVSPFTFRQMLLGETGGCIGETCALALIIGGLFLIVTRIISPATPIAFIGIFGVLTLIYTGSVTMTVYQLLAGGLMIGAFFMATDYATTPLTASGKIVFGMGCAVITFVIRQFGNYPEGVSFSILLMNLLTPYIDKICRTHPLGAKKPDKKAKEAAQ